MNPSVKEMKQSLRKEMLRKRTETKPEIINSTSKAIVPRMMDFIEKSLPVYKERPLTIMSYMSHAGEFPTRILNQAILEKDWQLILPYTTRDYEIEACIVDSINDLSISSKGIEEPDPSVCPHVNASDTDLILLPGIAFDYRGMRLGYGKGCYDRFLTDTDDHMPIIIALAWSFQVLEHIPSEKHDQACSFIFTENNLIRVADSNASDDR